ncbi:glycosyltransferase family 2 protein [Methyloversatilis discipulorum]|uniref:glycosyltransferase family 2 protein n=1 Tax=Methyloversatilis discipulorum TaxID=1119528 RepID=UPI0031382145
MSATTDSTAPRVSVVVPTHNRPALLREALASIAAQTCTDWEVVVVDDGSTPPIDAAELEAVVGGRLRLVRHAQPRGVAAARNSGFAAARGELIAQLDDDDRLAPEALSAAARALRDADVAFISVDAFGDEANDVNLRQRSATRRTLRLASASAEDDFVITFDGRLYAALLLGVPAAFQHPVFRRTVLDAVSPMANDHWPESAWAIEAAARGLRCVLIDQPLYQWRRDGQSYFSQATLASRMHEHDVEMKRALFERLQPVLQAEQGRLLGRALGNALFDRCWATQGAAPGFWRDFLRSLRLAPRAGHLALLLRRLRAG